ncbi:MULTISPECIES: FIST N-terminal domain-containing protein [unclassified Synechococcus]|uniref:FIST signal transduction protein n=1 Tax=unclassified Synechococcus TaxID=2626047 RepID=UPI00006985D8|nr:MULTISPECIES: FIST N-terminal domain-containing protein [unclassified Synechococcus]EAQ75447.1 hypothetical protein WH5701_01325 [Synechococcus sp. WH 5701]WFN59849.1 FIST C-terminal domain-containing protein [Synechococcus sp. CCFWC 502]
MPAPHLFSWLRRGDEQASCRTALSRQPSLEDAVSEVVDQLNAKGFGAAARGEADLALVFSSTSYASDLPRLLPLLRSRLRSRHWLGAAGGGVVGTGASGTAHEVEQESALSVMLLRLPGAELQLFGLDTDQLPDLDGDSRDWIDWVGADPELADSMLLLVDPTCQAINDLISGLDYAFPGLAKVGGIAGPHSASHGSLLLDDRVVTGAVGCLIGGSWTIDPVVAQGCRPIGPVFEIEQAERNVVLQLSRGDQQNTPVNCLQTILQTLNPAERELVRHSLFLGVARNSFNLAGGGGDAESTAFLVRNLIGVDPRNGAVAVAERLRVGQQVQFQLRDADASRQELRQLLRNQAKASEPPLAGLLFACLGRGKGLYGEADGDVRIAQGEFPGLPMAGAFCNGEIGPVGGSTYLHGYTASWGFLVPKPDAVASAEQPPEG